MNAVLTKRAKWRGALRRWRAWFHRNAWYAVVLLVLGVGMVEPLGCLLHCQIWLGADSSSAVQPAHHHASPVALSEQRTNASSGLDSSSLAATDPCFGHEAQCRPSHAPDRPESGLVHEHLGAIVVLVLLGLVVLAQYAVLAAPRSPPQRVIRPPLRPPIPLALAH